MLEQKVKKNETMTSVKSLIKEELDKETNEKRDSETATQTKVALRKNSYVYIYIFG